MAQPTAEQLKEIEAACELCSTGIGPQRAEAERYVVGLRSSENAIATAHFIITNSQNDHACFHAAIMLKEATLRDWHKIPPEQRNSLRGNLLQHVVQRGAALKRFVRQPLLQVVAIMVKRGWFEEAAGMFTEFLGYVQRLLEDAGTRAVGALMLLSLLEEFSSSNRSVVGLSWEFHNQCQQRFHAEGHLKMLFRLALSLLGGALETLRAQSSQEAIDQLLSEAGTLSWLGTCVAVVNQTLSWDFSDASTSSGVVGLSSLAPSTARADVILPGKGWSDVLVQQTTLDLLYGVYSLCRFSRDDALAHACRQSLVDISAIKGDVFPDQAARSAFLDHSLLCVLALVPSVREHEYVDLALIILRLMSNFQAKAVMSVPRAQAHLEALGGLTCSLMELSSSSDEPSLREALDSLLEVWSTMAVDLQMREEEPGMLEALAPYTAKIFRAYIDKSLRDAVREVEEWDAADEEHEDKSVGEERLASLGCIARAMLGDGLTLLSQLIRERTEALRGVLVEGRRLNDKEAGVALEQLHSLVSISARCIADEAEGELPMVPDACAQVSALAAARAVDDPVVVLTNQVVETIKVMDGCREAGHTELVSPMLVETMAHFLTRLSHTYLLPEVSERYQVSAALRGLFGAAEHGGGVESVLNFIVERALLWLSVWTSEEDVMTATTQLLLSLATRKAVGKMLLANASWHQFSRSIGMQVTNEAGVPKLPAAALSPAMHALCASVSSMAGGDEQRATTGTMLRELIAPVVERSAAVLRQGSGASHLVVRAVNLLHGACKSADFYTYDCIFELVAPVLEALPAALEACREHNDVTASLVQLYVMVGEAQVSYLSAQQMSFFNRCCLHMLQTFARVEGSAASSAPGAPRTLLVESNQEWLREHVLALLQLLLHLARKDVADFSNEGPQGQEAMDVGDVVLYGLSLIQPLITPEALGYPALAREYFTFLSWLIETYPHKVCVMHKPMLDPIVACLLHGISQAAESEIARKSVEAFDALASHTLTSPPPPSSPSLLDVYPLLQNLLDMLLFKQFNPAVLDAACDALLSLMCCQQQLFQDLMSQVVAGQVMENQRQQVRAFLGSVRPFLVTI